ncbi:hypothetical protein BS47DRAFT_9406 [Hydnum rufescens UP504]|uniref:Uncharacterized protein n=1 Tax=Hydnum rufescens UP504 TaxID=1448309 RepID=A0A9P6E0V0_9AGAM|nr:hypothetical protein BS47DRAFT_9406 [Hydnum rufescens UP504]
MILETRKQEETDVSALPATASWGQKGGTPVTVAASPTPLPAVGAPNGRATKTNGRHRDPVPSAAASTSAPRSMDSTARLPNTRSRPSERRTGAQIASSSRPSTPGIASLPPRPTTAADLAQAHTQPKASAQQDPSSLTSPKLASSKPAKPLGGSSHSRKPKSVEKVPALDDEPLAEEREATSTAPALRVRDLHSEPVPPLSPSSTVADSISSNQTPPPGLPLLSVGGQSTYQLSNQAKALMEDVLNRRSSANADAFESPFPDFDRTLSNLGDGSFSFNLSVDPKLAAGVQEASVDIVPASPMGSGIFDPFSNSGMPLSQFGQLAYPPPGIVPRHTPSSTSFPHSPLSSVAEESKPSRGSLPVNSAYAGSFNPFAESNQSTASQSPVQRTQPSPLDDDPLRRGSRFGFARKESSSTNSVNNGLSASANSSPLRYNDTLPLTPLYTPSDVVSPKPQLQQPPAWAYQRQQQEYNLNGYEKPSPRSQFQNYNAPQQSFAPFGAAMASDGSINLKDILAPEIDIWTSLTPVIIRTHSKTTQIRVLSTQPLCP